MDFIRIIKYSAVHIFSIVGSFCFVGLIFGGFTLSFHALDIILVIFLSIVLSLPIYIYLAYGADTQPYLVSFVTLFCVLVVLQIIVYILTANILFYGAYLIPLVMQIMVVILATYLGRKKGFVRYGL